MSDFLELREAPGLSANTLSILGSPGEPALLLVRYTHRQRRTFENLRFILEEQLEVGAREIPAVDPDRVYADSIARPVREAQALVSGHQTGSAIFTVTATDFDGAAVSQAEPVGNYATAGCARAAQVRSGGLGGPPLQEDFPKTPILMEPPPFSAVNIS